MNDVLGGNAQAQLRSVVERVERLEQEKADIADAIKDVYAEAKSNGFDTKIVRKVVRLRAMDPAKLREEADLVDVYQHALGRALVDDEGMTDAEAAMYCQDGYAEDYHPPETEPEDDIA